MRAASELVREILSRNRNAGVALALATGLSWAIHFADRNEPAGRIPTLHDEVLGLISFVVAFTMFSYVEGTGDRGMSRFPRRLFLLPVSTLQLVAIPIVTGVAGIVLLYLIWMDRLSSPGLANRAFVALMLAAFMVTYQSVLWALERFGALRLVVLGVVGVAFFWIAFLPAMDGPASPWRTRPVLAAIVAAASLAQFLLAWRFIARMRSEAERDGSRLTGMLARLADLVPRSHGDFRSASAAQIWFEWRNSGSGLPIIVAGTLVLLIAPTSIAVAGDVNAAFNVLSGTLALPLILAVPGGLAFAKPSFWSEDISLASFAATRPVSDAEMIAIKVKVAAIATAIVWLLTLGFLAAWLALWAPQPAVDRFMTQARSIGGAWWWAVAALALVSAMFFTWRLMIVGLWAGMSGSRGVFMAVIAPIGLVISGSAIFDFEKLPRWIAADLSRLDLFLVGGAALLLVKWWLAARGLRGNPQPTVWRYAALWMIGGVCFIGMVSVAMSRVGQALPADHRARVWIALLQVAALAIPMARVAWAPWFLGRNRHRP